MCQVEEEGAQVVYDSSCSGDFERIGLREGVFTSHGTSCGDQGHQKELGLLIANMEDKSAN